MNTITYEFLLTLVMGSLTNTETWSGEAVEAFVSEVQVPSGADEVAMIPGGVSKPKFLAFFGDEGIEVRLVASENAIFCNPVGAISDRRGIQNVDAAGVLISNTAAQAVTVTIIAVE